MRTFGLFANTQGAARDRGAFVTVVRHTAEVPGNLRVALGYAARGLAVFPCDATSKAPLIARGFRAASAEAEHIRAWWRSWPEAIVGLPTGPASGRWVLDIDVRDGKGGDEALFALEQTHGALPLTPMALTASGGYHYHFSYPPERRVVTRSNVWPGIDVRGDGGYVIAPGSVGARGRWEWEGSQDPDDGVALAPAPEWLLAAVCERATASPAPGPVRTGGPPPRGEVESLLAVLDPDADYDQWVRVGMILQGCGAEWGFEVWDAWSARGPKYPGTAALAERWQSFGHYAGERTLELGSLYAWARAAGWVRPVTRSEGPLPPAAPLEAYADEVGAAAQGKPKLKVVGGTEHDPRPTIRLEAGRLPEIVDDAEHYLISEGVGIYQHGTRLVRVGRWDLAPGPVERPGGAGVLIDVGPEWLKDRLTRTIRWERFDARSQAMRPTNCTAEIANTLLGRAGEWRFPRLTGFCDSPTLAADGRLIARAGYDPGSGLFLSDPPPIGEIGEIGPDDLLWARETLRAPVEEFPFCSEADHAAWVAMVLTALLRRSLPAAPIGCVSATTPATGKSKLAAMVGVIATGRPAPVASLGSTPEELEKRIDAVLLVGDPVVNFDNVDRPVKSDVMCQVVTEPVRRVRVMGLSKIVEAPTNIAMLMTGNNLTLIGDLVRRCLLCNLDAKVERPELREFSFEPVAETARRRTEMIRAALTLALGYQQAGCPPVGGAPFGSFEHWDRLIRRALIWAGYADPLAPAEGMRDQDHELAGMRDFLAHWQRIAPEPLSAQALSELIRDRLDYGGGDWRARNPELQESAVQVMGDLGKWGARELGYRLRSVAGRVFVADGVARRVAKGSQTKGLTTWVVESAI